MSSGESEKRFAGHTCSWDSFIPIVYDTGKAGMVQAFWRVVTQWHWTGLTEIDKYFRQLEKFQKKFRNESLFQCNKTSKNLDHQQIFTLFSFDCIMENSGNVPVWRNSCLWGNIGSKQTDLEVQQSSLYLQTPWKGTNNIQILKLSHCPLILVKPWTKSKRNSWSTWQNPWKRQIELPLSLAQRCQPVSLFWKKEMTRIGEPQSDCSSPICSKASAGGRRFDGGSAIFWWH